MTGAAPLVPDWLWPALVCPICHGGLRREEQVIHCLQCRAAFPQADPRVIDLMPEHHLVADRSRWAERQEEMLEAYRELLEDREHAILAYRSDYDPLAPALARYAGRILDLGGGNGIARHWLPGEAQYVSLEPSLGWLDQEWSGLADEFPCLGEATCLVRGVAERLPFGDACFDGVLSIWSLNHLSRPADALREVARALRPGGRLLLVLEDVAPRWGDILMGRYPTRDAGERWRFLMRKARSLLTGWSLQPDHLRVRERDLARWVRGCFRIVRREWIGAYLTYEYERKG